jgi:hypothetical protein
MMRKIVKIKYLSTFVALFLNFTISDAGSAYWISCPMPTYTYATKCGPTDNNPSLQSWECECKHPSNPGEFVILNVGQTVSCTKPAADNLINDPPAPEYCVASGVSLPSANGDEVWVSVPDSLNWMEPAPQPEETYLAEGFWKNFFYKAIPNGGSFVEQYLQGPHSNEGLDNPDVNLFINSARKELGFCQTSIANKCYSDWQATLQNCSKIPSGKAPGGKTTFQYCMDGGTENSQSTTLKDDLFACIDDVQTPGKGPWDSNRTRKYFPNTTTTTYAADAKAAADMMAEECIMELNMFSYNIVGAFDPYIK